MAESDEQTSMGNIGPTQPRLNAVKHAIEWILDVDTRARKRANRGDWVEKERSARTESVHRVTQATRLEELWQMRQPLANLVWPLMLEPPENSQLMEYQQVGVKWLSEEPGRILADDMGLGKTVQAIQAIRELVWGMEARSALVICPRTLVENWLSEIQRWAPELTTAALLPTNQLREEAWKALVGGAHICVTTYEQVRDSPEWVSDYRWPLVVLDEAHRVRNADSATSRAIRRLTRDRIWALTGTPVERDADDLATLLSVVLPNRVAPRDGSKGVTALRSMAKHVVLRRTKKDVLDQLPDVLEVVERLSLTDAQRASYLKVLRSVRTDMNYLATLTELRSICEADPESGASSKVDRTLEIVDAVSREAEKIVVFSFLLDPIERLAERLSENSIGYVTLTGSMDITERENSLHHFKTDQSVVAMLASSRVAGEGLTLTEANHVVFLNEWWNPSSNSQARDRVVRIGQDKVVVVYRFRLENTVDALLEDALNRKSELYSHLTESLTVNSAGEVQDSASARELVRIAASQPV